MNSKNLFKPKSRILFYNEKLFLFRGLLPPCDNKLTLGKVIVSSSNGYGLFFFIGSTVPG
jgi:hypothetical protein